MAQADQPSSEPAAAGETTKAKFWRRIFGKDAGNSAPLTTSPEPTSDPEPDPENSTQTPGLIRRMSRKVVPGLPRAQTFKRQQSEGRDRLEPVQPTQAERRAVSVDRRLHPVRNASSNPPLPRISAPDFLNRGHGSPAPPVASLPTSTAQSPTEEKPFTLDNLAKTSLDTSSHAVEHTLGHLEVMSQMDTQSVTTSHYDAEIHDELERKWILNLSMHFRDRSKREKFFVTYRQEEHLWRRVTVSLDYRNAPENSLEYDLTRMQYQREKSAKIYEAIRESLPDIQFYNTVTNLKLQTQEGRLHVHVVEDVNEIIHYPSHHMIHHLRCRRIRERDLEFDCHMSGFVYRVKVDGRILIKKEIPGPDTVDEFLYEVNALSNLCFSRNVIEFYGVVVSDDDKHVKGLLISYAEQGALIDIIYDHNHGLSWPRREKWARQIVQGLSDIHEAGFVQGDFTLSNIVIGDDDNAKIIDINRRGCPVGWEPPEATPLIDNNQRISMYIGVKSDLYQLGMVLWALATQEDEPESHGRPLQLHREPDVPPWYSRIVNICLSEEPRCRLQAQTLLSMFPESTSSDRYDVLQDPPSISVDDGHSLQEYFVDEHQGYGPRIRTVDPPAGWPYSGSQYVSSPGFSDYYPMRGRSPPSPLPSHHDPCDSPYIGRNVVWSHDADSPWESGHFRGGPSADTRATRTDTDEPSTPAEREVEAELKSFGDQFDGASAKAEKSYGKTTPTGIIQPLGGLSTNHPGVITDLVDKQPTPTIQRSEGSEPHTPMAESDFAKGITKIGSDPSSQGEYGPKKVEEVKGDVIIHGGNPGETAPDVEPAAQAAKEAEEASSEILGTPGYLSSVKEDHPGPAQQTLPEVEQDTEMPQATETVEQPSSPQLRTPPSTPPHDVSNDLKGVGAVYDQQSDTRQLSCSDEDLGLTATITTDVTA